MSDKLTDNEIIKALECCQYAFEMDKTCDFHCPMRGVNFCQTRLIISAFSLINRQKAEIERLQKHIQEGIDLAKQIPEMVALAQAEAIKEFEYKIKDKFDKHGVDYTAYVIVDDVSKEMVSKDNNSPIVDKQK